MIRFITERLARRRVLKQKADWDRGYVWARNELAAGRSAERVEDMLHLKPVDQFYRGAVAALRAWRATRW